MEVDRGVDGIEEAVERGGWKRMWRWMKVEAGLGGGGSRSRWTEVKVDIGGSE